jgi:hypothetical protein
MSSATIPPDQRPVFVLTQHRGGGTLLARLLNCHPDLVIWGEHGGFINQLAHADMLVRHYSGLLQDRPEAVLAAFLRKEPEQLRHFDPWLAPLRTTDLPAWSREFIRSVFARHVRADQRWGFKEIRYHEPEIAQFLARLFPHARFILLTRDPVALCLSSIFVSWSLEGLLTRGVQNDATEVTSVVEDCLYAIIAIQANFVTIEHRLTSIVTSLTYEALNKYCVNEMTRLFTFLGVDPSRETLRRVADASATVAGATNASAGQGFLTPAAVRAIAVRLLPEIRARLQRDGIDHARLRRLKAEGRYSYLLGDQGLANMSISSMF